MGKQKSKKEGSAEKPAAVKTSMKSAGAARISKGGVWKTNLDKKTKSASASALVQRPGGKPGKKGSKANLGVQSPPKPNPPKPSEKEGEQK